LRTTKFGFIVHPLRYEDLRKLPIVQRAELLGLPTAKIETLMSQVPIPPMRYGKVRNVCSGDRAVSGLLYAVPATTKMILSENPESLYWKVIVATYDAAFRGCSVFGLGAYTSIFGDAGETIGQWSPIPVTTGNGYTVVAVRQTIDLICQRCGIVKRNSRVLIVGATGSIGSACAKSLAGEVGEMVLLSSSSSKNRLQQLAEEIKVTRGTNLEEEVARADIVITATSANQPLIDIAHLKSGAIVCDIARPFDVFGRSRDDVLVVASGEVVLPGEGVNISSDIGLPRNGGRVYACLAETTLLAMSGQHQYATVGRQIDASSIEALERLGWQYKFQLAPLEGPDGPISEEQFDRIGSVGGRF